MSNIFLHAPHLMIFLLDAQRVLVTIKQGIQFHLRPTHPCHSTESRDQKFVYVFNPSTWCPPLFVPSPPLFVPLFALFAQIFVYIFHLSPPSVHFFPVAFLSWKISLLAFKSITCPLLDLSKVFLLNKLGDKSCVYFQDDETFYLKLKFFRNPCCLFLGLSHHDSLTRGFCQDFLLPKHVYSLINI